MSKMPSLPQVVPLRFLPVLPPEYLTRQTERPEVSGRLPTVVLPVLLLLLLLWRLPLPVCPGLRTGPGTYGRCVGRGRIYAISSSRLPPLMTAANDEHSLTCMEHGLWPQSAYSCRHPSSPARQPSSPQLVTCKQLAFQRTALTPSAAHCTPPSPQQPTRSSPLTVTHAAVTTITTKAISGELNLPAA